MTPRLALVAALLLASAGARAEPAEPPPPFEIVRSLTALQERIAAGDGAAQAAHARTIGRAGRAFAKAKASTWADRRNARALVVYLFSGGDARAVAAAVEPAQMAPGMEDLYAGALAYGLADDATARKKLMGIDAQAQPSGLGAHLALVQATLSASEAPAKATQLLDLARLLAPGTLVEEAALRKEMSLIGASGDLDKFALLTRRYLGTFARSSYADNFRELVARTAMDIGADDSTDAGARLAKLMNGLDKAEQCRLYLAIAHAAVVAGRTTIAALAGDAARKLAKPGEPEAERAMVYYGAAAIVGARYDGAKTALAEAAPERLGAGDRALRLSALDVAETIRQPLEVAERESVKAAEAAVAAEAERALASADRALKAARP